MKHTLCLAAILLFMTFSSTLAGNKGGDSGDDGWEEVPVKDVKKDKDILGLMDWAANIVFKKSAQKYNVSDNDVEVTKINSVWKLQADKTTAYYNFSVLAENDKGDVLDANFTAKYNSKTKQKNLRDWTSDLDINHDAYDDTDKSDSGDYGDDGDDGDDTDKSDDDWKNIDPSDFDSELIQGLAADGLAYVVKTDKRIPKDKYSVTEILAASTKHTKKADYYWFDIRAENKKGNRKLRIKFSSEVSGDTQEVLKYWLLPK